MDRTVAIEPTLSEFITKAQIRRAIEAAKIPYTYVVSGCFAGLFVPCLGQCHLRLRSPPRDKVSIYDTGNGKGCDVPYHHQILVQNLQLWLKSVILSFLL